MKESTLPNILADELGSTVEAKHLGADRVVAALEAQGVSVVFGLPGVHNLAIWRALSQSPIRLVVVHHEQAAAYAADGYARSTGRLGVCIVTSGPGAANTLGAVGEAMASGSPVLIIATDIPSELRRANTYRGVLHETRDQAAMFAPVVKRAITLTSAHDIEATVIEAGTQASEASTGPVYVGIPTDFLTATVKPHVHTPRADRVHISPTEDEFAHALELIQQSARPLIWAGGGAQRALAGVAIEQLAKRIAAPIVTTYMARGVVSRDHPCAVTPTVLMPQVGELWDQSDLVIAIGTDFDGTMTQNWLMPQPEKLLAVNIDRGDAEKNYLPELTLVGDAAAVVQVLADRAPARGGLETLTSRIRHIDRSVRQRLEAEDTSAVQFLDTMTRLIPADVVLLLDMCIPAYWLASFYPPPAPRRLHYPVGWGTLGFALPASLGATIGNGGRAVCVTGDGGFLFACGELVTLCEEQMPVTVILVDDGGYGMLRFDQRHGGDPIFGVDWRSPDFAALASSCNIDACVVEGFGHRFEDKLTEYLRAEGPNVLVVKAALKPPPTTFPHWYRKG